MILNANEEQNSVSIGKANLPTIFIIDMKFVVSNTEGKFVKIKKNNLLAGNKYFINQES